MNKKQELNRLLSKKDNLQAQLSHLTQQMADLNKLEEKTTIDWESVHSLGHKLAEIQDKVVKEKFYTDQLKHVINSRKDSLQVLSGPVHELRQQIKRVDIQINEANLRFTLNKNFVRSARETLNKLEETRDQDCVQQHKDLLVDFQEYKEKNSAYALYQISHDAWKTNQKLNSRKKIIKALKDKQANLKKQAQNKELISSLTQNMNKNQAKMEPLRRAAGAQSINDLTDKIKGLGPMRTNLLQAQVDIEKAMAFQSQLTTELHKELDEATLSNLLLERQEMKTLESLERNLTAKKVEIQGLELYINATVEANFSVILGVKSMLQTMNLPFLHFRNGEEALSYLQQKIKEYNRK